MKIFRGFTLPLIVSEAGAPISHLALNRCASASDELLTLLSFYTLLGLCELD